MVTCVSKPTITEFIYALLKNWASLVSGGLSVPFTIASIYSSGQNRTIFLLLAVTGVFIATYSLWAQERVERVRTQEELDETTAKLGRPVITVLLQHDETKVGQLWVCLMNYTDSPAVNVRADDISCGSWRLRLDPPQQVTAGYSPNVQFYCPDQGGSTRTDITLACAYNRESGGADVSKTMQLAIRYSDVDAQHEWVTFGRFFYNFATRRFTLEKQWIEKTGTSQKPVLTL